MPMIKVLYEGRNPKCTVCGEPLNYNGYHAEHMWLHQTYGLCSVCALDERIRRKIKELEDKYAAAEHMPSWWKRLWMSPLETRAILQEKASRREKSRKTAAENARMEAVE